MHVNHHNHHTITITTAFVPLHAGDSPRWHATAVINGGKNDATLSVPRNEHDAYFLTEPEAAIAAFKAAREYIDGCHRTEQLGALLSWPAQNQQAS